MSQDKQNFESILDEAMADARKRKDAYLRTEHLLAVVLQSEEIGEALSNNGFKLNKAQKELSEFLDTKVDTLTQDNGGRAHVGEPQPTQQVSKVLQEAFAQEKFFKMKSKGAEELAAEMAGESSGKNVVDFARWSILYTICKLSKKQGFAPMLLQQHGLTSEKVKEVLDKTYTEQNSESVISEYCTNLNDLCKEGKIDPIIGRDQEIMDTIEVLAKRKKANVVLVGHAGTGKTALGEGIARMIEEDLVPEAMAGYTILSVDLAGMLAGAKYRGDFEERLKTVIQHAEDNPKTVLFFDEVHNLFGAGSSNQSAMDASNILKPALASGKIRVIGTTTFDEYATHFRKDGAFTRRFVKINVDQPTLEETREILYGILEYYADYHDVTYSEECVPMAVDLAERYMRNKYFPDKAIDLIDAAGARAKLRDSVTVDGPDIISQVSKIAKVPEEMISVEETDLIMNLDSKLNDVVFGQEEAIQKITESVFIAKSGLRETNKPIANFMFLGSTGTGKTYLSKKLAEIMNCKLVRFDMSEYQERHSVSKLIGAPPGYVGYGEGQAGDGLLVSKVEEDPNCVLLLDEIEKAHKDIYKLLLQVMDDGTLTSSTGKTVDFSNVILIMTSNIGMQAASQSAIGFVAQRKNHEIEKAMKQNFAPEFLNRIDATITFNRLGMTEIKMIVDEEVRKVNDMLKSSNIHLSLSAAAKERIAYLGYDEEFGARPLARTVADEIKLPLSKKIINERLKDCHVRVSYNEEEGFAMTIVETKNSSSTVDDLIENVEA